MPARHLAHDGRGWFDHDDDRGVICESDGRFRVPGPLSLRAALYIFAVCRDRSGMSANFWLASLSDAFREFEFYIIQSVLLRTVSAISSESSEPTFGRAGCRAVWPLSPQGNPW